MLPIDILTCEAEAALRQAGGDPATLLAACRLDLSPFGEAGDYFLALGKEGELFGIPTRGECRRLSLSSLSSPYIDSYLSSCRLFAECREGDACRTVVLGMGSLSCRTRLFAFLAVLEAELAGKRLTGDEGLFDELRPKPPRALKQKGMLRRILPMFLSSRVAVAVALICLLLEIAIDLVRPYLSGTILFDRIIAEGGSHHSYSWLLLCLLSLIALALLRWGVILLRNISYENMTHKTVCDLQCRMFDKMQSMSLSFFNSTPVGRLYQYIGGDVQNIRTFFAQTTSLIICGLEFAIVSVLLFCLNWRLSLLILVPLPLVILVYRYAFPMLRRLDARAARENSSVSGFITGSLSGIRIVKAFSKEREEAGRLAARLDRLYRVSLQANLVSALLGPLVALLIYLADQAIWGFGGYLVIGGSLTYGEFCTYLGYVGMVFAPLNFFSGYLLLIGQTSESAARIASLLDAVPDVQESALPTVCERLSGEVEFCDVRFHYEPNRPILHGVSFRLAPGEHVGLVGHTGSGKSTLANLLLRLYDVTGGRILVDGKDVRELSFDTLRRGVAIVSQEIHLFAATVADNIRYARPTATDEEVVAAARAAAAHDFIMALPEGYNTPLGRGGPDLSGGERQRISIARALIAMPDILILDEATAAMDNATEGRIATALDALSRGRTTISIAHRLSSLRGCSRILVMEHGHLVEDGAREELLAKENGIYRRLHTLQEEQLMQVLKGERDEPSA